MSGAAQAIAAAVKGLRQAPARRQERRQRVDPVNTIPSDAVDIDAATTDAQAARHGTTDQEATTMAKTTTTKRPAAKAAKKTAAPKKAAVARKTAGDGDRKNRVMFISEATALPVALRALKAFVKDASDADAVIARKMIGRLEARE